MAGMLDEWVKAAEVKLAVSKASDDFSKALVDPPNAPTAASSIIDAANMVGSNLDNTLVQQGIKSTVAALPGGGVLADAANVAGIPKQVQSIVRNSQKAFDQPMNTVSSMLSNPSGTLLQTIEALGAALAKSGVAAESGNIPAETQAKLPELPATHQRSSGIG